MSPQLAAGHAAWVDLSDPSAWLISVAITSARHCKSTQPVKSCAAKLDEMLITKAANVAHVLTVEDGLRKAMFFEALSGVKQMNAAMNQLELCCAHKWQRFLPLPPREGPQASLDDRAKRW